MLLTKVAHALKLILSFIARLFGRHNRVTLDNPSPAPEEVRTDQLALAPPLPEEAAVPTVVTEAMGSVESAPEPKLPTTTFVSVVIATARCRNRRHSVTGEQCEAQVPVNNRTGGCCADCVHTCSGGCGRTIPVFHAYCTPCRKSGVATKPCKGCEATIAFDGPSYCTECGHQCAGPDCTAFVPKRFTYCMAEPCQDAKWQKEHPMPKAFGTTIGAQLAAKKKREKSERDRALRDSMKGKKQSAPKPGHR